MRIGIVTDHPYEAPLGYSIRPRELSTSLAKLGCEVHIFSPVDKSSKFSDNLFIHGIPSYQEPFVTTLHRFVRKAFKSSLTARYLYRKKALERLSKQLAKSISSKVKECNIEILQGEKEIASMATVILGKRLGIPAVSDIHGLLAEEAVQYKFLKKNGKEYVESRGFQSEVLHGSDAIVVVSENLKSHLSKSFDLDKERLFVVPNAGTPQTIVRSPKSETNNIVYAGILEPWERVDLAIASIPYVIGAHAKVMFSIAGAGSLKKDLVKFVNQSKLNKHVNFVGTISYDKVADFLAKSDIAVLPSTKDVVRKVACPIKLFTYLAAGLPVVTVSGLWWSDFLRQNNVGLIADNNPQSFADAINELLSNRDKINEMSENAIQLVKEKYNWTEMAKRLFKVYEETL